MGTKKKYCLGQLPLALIVACVGFCFWWYSERSTSEHPFPLVGIEQSEKRYLHSKTIGETYALDVWLPRDYHDNPKQTYPVLYLTDSELNFPLVSFVVRRLTKNKDMPASILVGISHNTTYENWYYQKRARDLTPVEWGHKDFPATGGAKRFLHMIQTELIPFVEANYRVDSTDRTLMGMSFGGLFAHFVLFQNPNLFQRYLIVSPSVWYGKRFLLGEEKRFSKKKHQFKARIYTAVGSLEPKDFIQDWTTLTSQMRGRNTPGLVIDSEILDGENHRSISPRAFTNGLRSLFQ